MHPIKPLNEYEKLSDEDLEKARQELRDNITDVNAGVVTRTGNLATGVVKGAVAGGAVYVGTHAANNHKIWVEAFKAAEEKSGGKLMDDVGHAVRYFHFSEAAMRISEAVGPAIMKAGGKQKLAVIAGAAVALGSTAAFAHKAWKETDLDMAGKANTVLSHVERIQDERTHAAVNAKTGAGRDGPA